MKQDLDKLDTNFAARTVEAGVQWVDIRELGVEGRGFEDTKVFYDRWPARAEGVVPGPVWELSQHSAGMCVRFVTDAVSVSARWTLRFESMAMDHMPATGVSGVDLYTRYEGKWRWLANGRPGKFPTTQLALVGGMSPGRREMMLYLPLYNGVSEVFVGVPESASLEPAPAWTGAKAKPICFYGTSIVHGGCASRTGMSYPAIISRRFDHPHINLGFSGNGRCEADVAKFLGELDPAAYVIDPLPNMAADVVAERMEKFVRILRGARPATPILLVENIVYQNGYAVTARYERYTKANATLRGIYDALVAEGMKGLHYLRGDDLLGDDGEGTVDGTHPTDVGFMRMAEVIGAAVKPLIG